MLDRTARYTQLTAMLFLIMICAGCLKSPISRPKNLKPLTKETTHDTQTKEQVTAYTKKLDYKDQELMFGKYANQLEKYKIIPVQLTLENKSGTCWVLANSNISLDKLKIDDVNAKLFASRRWWPLWIFLGGTALTIIAAPLLGCATFAALGGAGGKGLLAGYCGLSAAYISAGIIFATTSCISIIDGITGHFSKKELRKYLKNNCKDDSITLTSDTTATMLFFVEEAKMPSSFDFILINKNIEKDILNFNMKI